MRDPHSRSRRLAGHGYLLASISCGIGLLVVGLVDGDQVLGMAFAATGAALLVLWGVQRDLAWYDALMLQVAREACEIGRTQGYAEGYVSGLSRRVIET